MDDNLSHLWAECLENVESSASHSHTSICLQSLLQGTFYFSFNLWVVVNCPEKTKWVYIFITVLSPHQDRKIGRPLYCPRTHELNMYWRQGLPIFSASRFSPESLGKYFTFSSLEESTLWVHFASFYSIGSFRELYLMNPENKQLHKILPHWY
jgi:hypothetical protein